MNTCFNEGLMFQSSAFQIFHRGNNLTFINFHVPLSHRHGTTVSLKTRILLVETSYKTSTTTEKQLSNSLANVRYINKRMVFSSAIEIEEEENGGLCFNKSDKHCCSNPLSTFNKK